MEALQAALSFLFTPSGLAMVAVGTFLGILVGAVPGLTGAMLIALTLPLTITLDPHLAMPAPYAVQNRAGS